LPSNLNIASVGVRINLASEDIIFTCAVSIRQEVCKKKMKKPIKKGAKAPFPNLKIFI